MSAIKSPYFTRFQVLSIPVTTTHDAYKSTTKRQKPATKNSSSKKLKKENTDEAISNKGESKQKKAKVIKKEIKQEVFDYVEDGDKGELKWEPKNWMLQLNHIRKMREEKNAPIDTMGCEKCKGINFSEKDKRFHTLVSLMLSSQTKDQVTHAAMLRLIDDGLSVESVLKMTDTRLGELIYPVGFWKKKISYIKRTAEMLKKDYNSDIPETVEDLVKLPGVGPKMAYLAMSCAWNKVVGIGVDVHVHRIANRLKWVRKSTSGPEKTRKELEDWLPKSYWREVNWLLVGFGQQICLPVKPKCSECLNKNICPSTTAKSMKIKKEE